MKKLSIQKKTFEQVMTELRSIPSVWDKYCALTSEYQEMLIKYAMGESGIPVTYDRIFREIFDAHLYPERLESFLSAILNRSVRIVEILDREGIHLAENAAFVIVDIIVRTEEGEYIDVEMQKIGYAFPVQRADCYTADMIMRQYDRLKKQASKNKKPFYFSSLSKVITVVIMESSSAAFQQDHHHDVHHRHSVFDTGICADGLAENYFVCLDIYCKYIHTKIKTKKDAWMLFLGSQSIVHILEVCDAFPEFIPLYEQVFSYQKEVSAMADVFYEALKIMNHNTEMYMIEELREKMQAEMQAEIARHQEEMQAEADRHQEEIGQKDATIIKQQEQIKQLQQKLAAVGAESD